MTIHPEEEDDDPIVGVGDAASSKQAEKLAALSAVYQLDARGLVCATDSFAVASAK